MRTVVFNSDLDSGKDAAQCVLYISRDDTALHATGVPLSHCLDALQQG
jgi:hypothetical protein